MTRTDECFLNGLRSSSVARLSKSSRFLNARTPVTIVSNSEPTTGLEKALSRTILEPDVLFDRNELPEECCAAAINPAPYWHWLSFRDSKNSIHASAKRRGADFRLLRSGRW